MKCGVKYAKLGKKILLVSPQILYIAIPNVFIIVVLIIMTASPSSSETKLVDLFSLANPGMSSGIPGGVISPLSQTLVGVRNVFAVVYAFVLLLNCIMSYFVVSKFKKASSCLLMNMLSVLGVLPFQILFFDKCFICCRWSPHFISSFWSFWSASIGRDILSYVACRDGADDLWMGYTC